MKRNVWALCWISVCLLLAPKISYSNNAVASFERAVCGSMLLEDDWRSTRYAAKAIKAKFPDDELLNDLIAERLSQVKVTENTTSKESDVTLTLVEVLTGYNTDRYLTFLKKIGQENDYKTDVRTLIDSLKPTISRSQFVPSGIDLATVRADFLKTMATYKKEDRSEFSFLVQISTLDELLKKVGGPDLVSAWKVHAPKLEFHYIDLGLVILNLDTSNPAAPQWKVLMTANELTKVSKVYTGQHFDVAQNLASIRGKRLKMYTKSNKSIFKDVALLSVLIYRMADTGKFDNAYEKVVTEKVLSVLSRSKDPIVVDTLKYAAKSRNTWLAKAASNSLLHRGALEATPKLEETATDHDEDESDEKDDDDKQ